MQSHAIAVRASHSYPCRLSPAFVQTIHKYSAFTSSAVPVKINLPRFQPPVYLYPQKSHSASFQFAHHSTLHPHTKPDQSSSSINSSYIPDSLPFKLTSTSPRMSEPLYSKLYKAFLDDPTLSDLTLRLGDRSVYAHRIVLCRGSEYFAHMLTGRFKVSHSPCFTHNELSKTDFDDRNQLPRRSSSKTMTQLRCTHFSAFCTTSRIPQKPTRSGLHP
jgi:hypothetical protein